MKRFLFFIMATAGLFALITNTSGCTSDQIAQWTQVKQQVKAAEAPTTQAIADIQTQIALLPPNDPVRIAAEAKLQKLQTTLAKADGVIAAADAAIQSINSGGALDPSVVTAANSIPYGGLILTAIMGVASIAKNVKQAAALKDAHAAVMEVAGDTATSLSDAPFSKPTAAILTQLGVDTPGTAGAQADAAAKIPQI